ncbi:uncharacterized protein LOC118656674 isoform X2 [Myotis myotis]|uniref:uncharacterized protein LOC118656674 isoform X2 n=1 Tax=Myotis myotis TaxID=51298 RepID=UPI00174EBAFC|nr:uncharacterized protein LOC118656674 isoform X2 [Myotis myotis]
MRPQPGSGYSGWSTRGSRVACVRRRPGNGPRAALPSPASAPTGRPAWGHRLPLREHVPARPGIPPASGVDGAPAVRRVLGARTRAPEPALRSLQGDQGARKDGNQYGHPLHPSFTETAGVHHVPGTGLGAGAGWKRQDSAISPGHRCPASVMDGAISPGHRCPASVTDRTAPSAQDTDVPPPSRTGQHYQPRTQMSRLRHGQDSAISPGHRCRPHSSDCRVTVCSRSCGFRLPLLLGRLPGPFSSSSKRTNSPAGEHRGEVKQGSACQAAAARFSHGARCPVPGIAPRPPSLQ